MTLSQQIEDELILAELITTAVERGLVSCRAKMFDSGSLHDTGNTSCCAVGALCLSPHLTMAVVRGLSNGNDGGDFSSVPYPTTERHLRNYAIGAAFEAALRPGEE